jgi:hypothetical protein
MESTERRFAVSWRPVSADESSECCDLCGATIEGEAAGRGLLLFVRGDCVVREEPPLCRTCAHAVNMSALSRFVGEEEEG